MPSPRPLVRLVLSAGLVLALLVPLAACGGGGGGTLPTPGDPVPPPVDPATRTGEMLSACGGKTAIDALQTIAGMYEDFVDGSAGAVGFSLLTGQIQNDPGLVVPWELELNGQPGPEATGLLAWEDAQGAPVVPYTPQQLMPVFQNGIGGLPALLGATPDGTQFIVVVQDRPGTPNVSGDVRTTFIGGLPTTTSGTAVANEGGCTATTTWSGLALGALVATYPTGVFTLQVDDDGDTLTGTLTTNGTNTATASVALNGGAPSVWSINLDTGVVTPAP